MVDIVAINSNDHVALKIKENNRLDQAKASHFAPLVVQEFVPAGQEFPITFIKDSETGKFRAIALLGIKPGDNLFYSADSWQATYKPEGLTLFPFVLNHSEEQSILCFDQESSLVNKAEGNALFDEKGNQSEWLQAQGEKVVQYVEKSFATNHFIQMLLDNDLLSPQTLNLKLENEEGYTLNGLYAIDEKKLNALSNESFNALRKTGALPAIYAALLSMQRIQSLVQKKLAKSK
jgi:hypothetical protein